MLYRYWFLLLLALPGFGQSGADLRAAAERTQQQPPSARRDSALHKTYYALTDLYWMGNSQQSANHDSAMFYATAAIRIAPTARMRADAFRKRGTLFHSNTMGFNTAWMGLDDLNKAANLFITLHDSVGLQKTFSDIATLYLIRYDLNGELWGNNLHYATLGLRIQSDPTFQWPTAINAPATDAHATPAQVREAIRAGEQNLAYWQRKGSKPHQMWRLELLGRYYHQSGLDKEKGKQCQQEALQIALALPDIHIAYACLTNLSQWALDAGDLPQSLAYARQGLQLSQRERTIPRQAMFHDRLYYTFRAMKQMDSAYAHKDANIAINDSLSRVGDQRQIQYLKAEKRQRELESELQRRNNWLYWLVGIGMLLAGATLVFTWRNRLLRKKNSDLQAAVLKGQTIERQRVAADLHDSLGTTLSALHWNLEAMNTTNLTAPEQAVYATIRQQVSQAHKDIRLLSHNLLPDELAKQGLATALRVLVDKLNHNTAVRFHLTGTDDLPRLDRQTEFELYSICLELANNILKHANATEAHITIARTTDGLHLTISDNGSGLSEERGSGRGLQNVAARVAALGGSWEIVSEPGQGVENRVLVQTSHR